ncbi:MAG: hypothetical protein HKL85_01530 [Acidimicrobiaceae bacterium]|nr:hypothetical protein [Acidimicrobiaceae bacterium]
MIANGDVADSLRIFREHLLSDTPSNEANEHLGADVHIDSVTTPSGSFDVQSGASMHFDVHITSATAYSGNFILEVFTRGGVLVSRSDSQSAPINLLPGANTIGIDLPDIPLLDGVFDINVGVVDPRGSNVKAWGEKVATLQVTYGGRQGGLVELDATIRQN